MVEIHLIVWEQEALMEVVNLVMELHMGMPMVEEVQRTLELEEQLCLIVLLLQEVEEVVKILLLWEIQINNQMDMEVMREEVEQQEQEKIGVVEDLELEQLNLLEEVVEQCLLMRQEQEKQEL